jgi:hypothetical protein
MQGDDYDDDDDGNDEDGDDQMMEGNEHDVGSDGMEDD